MDRVSIDFYFILYYLTGFTNSSSQYEQQFVNNEDKLTDDNIDFIKRCLYNTALCFGYDYMDSVIQLYSNRRAVIEQKEPINRLSKQIYYNKWTVDLFIEMWSDYKENIKKDLERD